MLKQVVKSAITNSFLRINHRSFLSEAFRCQEAWQARLSTPVLSKVNHDALYYDLEQKFQQKNQVSAIDIDIYVNKIQDDSHIDEVADLLYKFRLTSEATNVLESTQHAIIRSYIDHGHYSELIEVLNNRVGYGVFLDDFTANLALDRLIVSNEFKWAARVATLLALQEDFCNPITRSLAIYACYRFIKDGDFDQFDDLIPPPPVEAVASEVKKKKEEIKIRVKFLRNEFFDDHFDLKDTKLLLGKTFYILGLNHTGIIASSSKLLGLILYEKYHDALTFLQTNKETICTEIVNLVRSFLEKSENQESKELQKLLEHLTNNVSTVNMTDKSFETLLLDLVKKSVEENEQNQIENQIEIYNDWCDLRQKRLDEELARLQRAQRIQDMERIVHEMDKEEQKLWFFENEDKIDLQIDSKRVFYPKRWFGKKKKPRAVDEGYVPPEVRQRQTQY